MDLVKLWSILVGLAWLVAGITTSLGVTLLLVEQAWPNWQIVTVLLLSIAPFVWGYMWMSPQFIRLRSMMPGDILEIDQRYQKSIGIQKKASDDFLERGGKR